MRSSVVLLEQLKTKRLSPVIFQEELQSGIWRDVPQFHLLSDTIKLLMPLMDAVGNLLVAVLQN
jgi:hypothetical protein